MEELIKNLEIAENNYNRINKILHDAKIENSKAYKLLQEAKREITNFKSLNVNKKEKKISEIPEKYLIYLNIENLDFDRIFNELYCSYMFDYETFIKNKETIIRHMENELKYTKWGVVLFYMLFSRDFKSKADTSRRLDISSQSLSSNIYTMTKNLRSIKFRNKLKELYKT